MLQCLWQYLVGGNGAGGNGDSDVTIKECASILGISPNSVHKTRYRLKQRLGLEQDEDLERYIVSTDVIKAH